MPPEIQVHVLGIRGFPGVQGGAERHAEELYPRLARLGLKPVVYARTPYFPPDRRPYEWQGVRFVYRRAPRNQYLEAIWHTFVSALHVLRHRREVGVVHVHNIGPALCLPLLKWARIPTVLTYHSPNYEHRKWGPMARWVLRLGERVGLRHADAVITVSEPVRQALAARYPGRTIVHIPNGVTPMPRVPAGDTLQRWDLESRRYVFTACRFAQGKGLEDLIQAFARLKRPDLRLVIAGGADHETAYSRFIRKLADSTPGVVLPGVLTGLPLAELYSQAGLFVLPSYNEGLPLSLLEAMASSIPVLASDIPANRAIGLQPHRFYPVGSIEDLARKISELLPTGLPPDEDREYQSLLTDRYNWDKVAARTREVLAQLGSSSP